MTRQDNQKERENIAGKMSQILELEEVIKVREDEIEAHKRQYSELESKTRAVEGRSM